MSITQRMAEIIDALQREGMTLHDAAESFDAQYVRAALQRTQGNVSQAAQMLGVHRNTLHYRLVQNDALRVKPKQVRRHSGFERWKGAKR